MTTLARPETVSKKGFEEVALAELPVLYRVAKRMARDPHAAEDLVGQALLNAAKAWPAFDGRHPRSWLIRIVRNEFLATKRNVASRFSHRSIEETDAIEDGPFEAIAGHLMQDEVIRALDKLPEEYRMAVTLCDMEEMSYEEAADAMEVPVGTVRSRLYRGRKLLRQKLVALEENP
jgi:RNA polymerase sigma-70 factor (ECF subfamily)